MLKQKTIAGRIRRKEHAAAAYEEAKLLGDTAAMRMHAMATTRINKEIVESSKKLLDYMGIAYISAPSEGEAQASYMSKASLVYAAASQDYDTMLFGSTYVARNLTFSGKRKLPGKNIYINVDPEIVSFADTLKSLDINHKQLVWLGILLGTDFNEGIKGVGPKNALKIAKASKSIEDVKSIVKEKYDAEFGLDIQEVEDLFMNPEVKEMESSDVDLLLKKSYDMDKIVDFMCKEHEFSEDRIRKTADRLAKVKGDLRQKGMDKWFK